MTVANVTLTIVLALALVALGALFAVEMRYLRLARAKARRGRHL